jgi:hypothetical protein
MNSRVSGSRNDNDACLPAGRGDAMRRPPFAGAAHGPRVVAFGAPNNHRFQRHTPGDALRRPYPPLSHVVVGPLTPDLTLDSRSPTVS